MANPGFEKWQTMELWSHKSGERWMEFLERSPGLLKIFLHFTYFRFASSYKTEFLVFSSRIQCIPLPRCSRASHGSLQPHKSASKMHYFIHIGLPRNIYAYLRPSLIFHIDLPILLAFIDDVRLTLRWKHLGLHFTVLFCSPALVYR